MRGLVPRIHALRQEDVDSRDIGARSDAVLRTAMPGHDGETMSDADNPIGPQDVLAFWRAAGPDKWFTKDDGFDAEIRTRFLATYEAAAAGRLTSKGVAWDDTPE